MSKDRDGSVRARKVEPRCYHGRYKYAGRWYRVCNAPGIPALFDEASQAREAAYAMYNVAVNGGKHQ